MNFYILGFFVNTAIVEGPEGEPFSDQLYIMATVLDPSFGFHWLNHRLFDDSTKDMIKTSVKDNILAECGSKGMVLIHFNHVVILCIYIIANSLCTLLGHETEEIPSSSDGNGREKHGEQTEKEAEGRLCLPQLFNFKRSIPGLEENQLKFTTAVSQLHAYFDLLTSSPTALTIDPLKFWHSRRKEYPLLYDTALRYLSVPASSSPIERVFSHGGIIMRPHRASMTDTTLSNLVFLKCNKKYI